MVVVVVVLLVTLLLLGVQDTYCIKKNERMKGRLRFTGTHIPKSRLVILKLV